MGLNIAVLANLKPGRPPVAPLCGGGMGLNIAMLANLKPGRPQCGATAGRPYVGVEAEWA